jgi:hypothetical protein
VRIALHRKKLYVHPSGDVIRKDWENLMLLKLGEEKRTKIILDEEVTF